MRKAIIFIFALEVLSVSSQFDLQFIGNSVPLEDEQNRDFCESKYCLLDADILFYAATQNASVQPCDDFKEFALGTFIKYRAVNDRKQFNGLWGDVQDAHTEKQRKLLSEEINDKKDSRVIKKMKKFFGQCINSTFVKGEGTQMFRNYFKSFGVSIYPSKNQSNFNISKLFEQEPEESTFLFLKHELQRCQHPKEPWKEILCLKSQKKWKDPESIFASYSDVLYEMNRVDKNASFAKYYREEFEDISRKMFEFYKVQEKAISKTKLKSKFIKIKNLNKLTSVLSIDWLKVFNNQLSSNTKLTENDAIWVERPHVIKTLATLIRSTNLS